MKYMCPICGFDGLMDPPYDDFNLPSYEICPCCGFEFRFDDQEYPNFDNYRNIWIDKGAQWFFEDEKPNDWSLEVQLKNVIKSKSI